MGLIVFILSNKSVFLSRPKKSRGQWGDKASFVILTFLLPWPQASKGIVNGLVNTGDSPFKEFLL